MNGLRYDSAGSSQPVYPPHLVASAGCPAGPRPFPPAEPGYPTMLPGFPEAWPDRAAPQPIAASTVYRPPVTEAQPPAYYYAPAAPAAHPRYPASPAFLGVHEAAYAAYQRDRAAASGPSRDGDTPVRPPRVLIVGVATGLTAVGATVVGQLLALSGGREAIKAAVEGRIPGAAGPFSRLIAAAVNSAYHTIQVRAAFSIGLAMVAAVLLAFALWAGLVTRLTAVGAMAL